jgi:exodeoxyribonuclease-5
MRRSGCRRAQTLHSLIYLPREKSRARLEALMKKQAEAEVSGDEAEAERLRVQVEEEYRKLKQPSFVLNEESELPYAKLLVIDECSMVGEDMACDLLSFGVRVLVLGDPAQLPPVRGSGYFTDADPDVMLTEIHRQALDNPIIAMATDVREGRGLAYGEYGESQVLHVHEYAKDEVPIDVQVLVGRNTTRRRANLYARNLLFQGADRDAVVPGEKIVCLRNDKEEGILNGQLFRVLESMVDDDEALLRVEQEDDGEEHELTVVLDAFKKAHDPDLPEIDLWASRHRGAAFDYGYALTCHKAQGSQWPEVVVVDESRVFRQHAQRWLYTALTRAEERVTVVR